MKSTATPATIQNAKYAISESPILDNTKWVTMSQLFFVQPQLVQIIRKNIKRHNFKHKGHRGKHKEYKDEMLTRLYG